MCRVTSLLIGCYEYGAKYFTKYFTTLTHISEFVQINKFAPLKWAMYKKCCKFLNTSTDMNENTIKLKQTV